MPGLSSRARAVTGGDGAGSGRREARGDLVALISELTEQMHTAAAELQFEIAAGSGTRSGTSSTSCAACRPRASDGGPVNPGWPGCPARQMPASPASSWDRRLDEDFDPLLGMPRWLAKTIRRRVGPVLLSLAAAMVAALCYGVAAVMQAMAARSRELAVPARMAGGAQLGTGAGRPSLVLRMLRQWRFIASLVLDLVGFVAQLVALRRLPLFAVQAIIAANLAVTAVVAAWLIHLELSWREWLAVAGVVVGVGLLGSSAGEHVVTGVSGQFKLALILAVARHRADRGWHRPG